MQAGNEGLLCRPGYVDTMYRMHCMHINMSGLAMWIDDPVLNHWVVEPQCIMWHEL